MAVDPTFENSLCFVYELWVTARLICMCIHAHTVQSLSDAKWYLLRKIQTHTHTYIQSVMQKVFKAVLYLALAAWGTPHPFVSAQVALQVHLPWHPDLDSVPGQRWLHPHLKNNTLFFFFFLASWPQRADGVDCLLQQSLNTANTIQLQKASIWRLIYKNMADSLWLFPPWESTAIPSICTERIPRSLNCCWLFWARRRSRSAASRGMLKVTRTLFHGSTCWGFSLPGSR